MTWSQWIELLALVLGFVATIYRVRSGTRVVRGDLDAVKIELGAVKLHVTNHLPHQIAALETKVRALPCQREQ